MEVSIGVVRRNARKKGNPEVLLIKRAVPEGSLIWQFPGGKVEPNESISQAAQREVLEETSVICKPFKKLGEKEISKGKEPLKIHYFLCDYTSGRSKKTSNEVDKVEWVDITKLKDYITSPIQPNVEAYFNQLSRQNQLEFFEQA